MSISFTGHNMNMNDKYYTGQLKVKLKIQLQKNITLLKIKP